MLVARVNCRGLGSGKRPGRESKCIERRSLDEETQKNQGVNRCTEKPELWRNTLESRAPIVAKGKRKGITAPSRVCRPSVGQGFEMARRG